MTSRELTPEVKTEWLEAASAHRWATALYISCDFEAPYKGPTGPRSSCAGVVAHDSTPASAPEMAWTREQDPFDRNPPVNKRVVG